MFTDLHKTITEGCSPNYMAYKLVVPEFDYQKAGQFEAYKNFHDEQAFCAEK